MEYANTASYERLTGRALFTPTGEAGAIDLGNITAIKNDYGAKSISVMRNTRGKQTLARRDNHAVEMVYTITGDQFATPIVPLLVLGEANADFSQSSGTGATFTFTAAKGRSYYIGAYNVTLTSVTVSAAAKTRDSAFFFDEYNGVIDLPVVPNGIADGDSVVVTFDKPALTMESYTALSKLNRPGTIKIHLEDEYGPPSKEIWSASCQVSMKKGADRDPSKFSEWDLEISIFSTPTVYKRKS